MPDVFTTTVPLDAWKQGNFSTLRNSAGSPITIYDPTTTQLNANGVYTRTAFPGNIVPANRMDPVAVRLMQYFPEPNTTPTNANTQVNNWTKAATDAANSTDFAGRVDQNFSESWRTFVRYAQGSQTTDPHNFFRQVLPLRWDVAPRTSAAMRSSGTTSTLAIQPPSSNCATGWRVLRCTSLRYRPASNPAASDCPVTWIPGSPERYPLSKLRPLTVSPHWARPIPRASPLCRPTTTYWLR